MSVARRPERSKAAAGGLAGPPGPHRLASVASQIVLARRTATVATVGRACPRGGAARRASRRPGYGRDAGTGGIRPSLQAGPTRRCLRRPGARLPARRRGRRRPGLPVRVLQSGRDRGALHWSAGLSLTVSGPSCLRGLARWESPVRRPRFQRVSRLRRRTRVQEPPQGALEFDLRPAGREVGE